MGLDKLQKLIAKREEMTAKIRQELGRDARKRRQDTRRKIIAGGLVLIEQDPAIKAWLQRTVNVAVTRNDDRALFGLPPLRAEPVAPEQTDVHPKFGRKPPGAKSGSGDQRS